MDNEQKPSNNALDKSKTGSQAPDDLASLELADEVLLHKNSRALDRLEQNIDTQKRNRRRRELVLQSEIESLKEQTRRLELGLANRTSFVGVNNGATQTIATRREDLLNAEEALLREQTRRLELEGINSLAEAERRLAQEQAVTTRALVAQPEVNAVNASLAELTRTMELELKAIRNELNAFKSGQVVAPVLPEKTSNTSAMSTAVTEAVEAATNFPVTKSAEPVATSIAVTTVENKPESPAVTTVQTSANMATPIVEELKAAQDGLTSIISTKAAGFIPAATAKTITGSDRRWVSAKVHELKDTIDRLTRWDSSSDKYLQKALQVATRNGVSAQVINTFQTDTQKTTTQLRELLSTATSSYNTVVEAQHAGDLSSVVERLTTTKALTIELQAKQLALNEALVEVGVKEKAGYATKVTRELETARKHNTELINTMMFYIKRVSPVLEKARQDEVNKALSTPEAAVTEAKAKKVTAAKEQIDPRQVKQLVYAWDDVKHRFNLAQVALKNATEHVGAKRYLKAQAELTRYKVLTADFWDAKRWNEMALALKGVGAKRVIRPVDKKLWIGLVIVALVLAAVGVAIGALFGVGVLAV